MTLRQEIISEIDEYFKELPIEKVRRYRVDVGIEEDFERSREEQLMWQLPRQDIALAYCKYVEPEFWSHFEHFVNIRNTHALDIGYEKSAGEFHMLVRPK